MKTAIVYLSRTGNTELLAKAVREEAGDTCVYFGAPDAQALQADLIFAGFWTDKGTCGEELRALLEMLHGKTVAVFGTAGFGGSSEYFARLLSGVEKFIAGDNRVAEGFMCQGKMPLAVRERYVKMGNAQGVENFDKAASHPNAEDLAAVRSWAGSVMKSAEAK